MKTDSFDRMSGWMERVLVLCGAVFALSTTGCSSGSPSEASPSADAGSTSQDPSGPSARATKTVATLRAIPAFAEHLAANRTLHRVDAGYRLAGSQTKHAGGWRQTGSSVDITLPATGSAPLRLEYRAQKDFWVEIRSTGAKDVAGEVVNGAVVLHDVGEDTDVVHALAPGSAEEIRVLRSARASATTHYSVRLGPAVGLIRSRDGRFEILDRSGNVRMVSAPVFAVDANGTRRDATVRAEGAGAAWELSTSIDVEALAYPIAVDPVWTASESMQVGMIGHQTVLLQDGRVLATGGKEPPNNVTAVAQIYDPVNDSWSVALPMQDDRRDHRMTLLDDGRVLVTGGITETQALPPAGEIYDATTGQWSLTNSYFYGGRGQHIAAKLQDGRVLIAGGWAGGMMQTAEVYDPATNQWTDAATMPLSPANQASITLPSGKVLVVGGTDFQGAVLDTAFTYDPALDEWADAGTMASPRYNTMGLVLLQSGKVLVAGGDEDTSANTVAAAEIYDPDANSWTPVEPMSRPRGYTTFRMGLLANGKVLATGGYSLGGYQQSAEIYDPTADTWTSTGPMLFFHNNASMTRLSDGRLLLSGGTDYVGTNWTECEIFALHPVGDACNSATECESTYCIDGVCCDTACTGQCESCANVGSEGTCGLQIGYPTGGRPPCTGSGTTCGGFCNGSSTTCTYPTATTPCRTASCTNGTETLAATCNGSGSCPLSQQACSPYVCEGSACGSACVNDSECAATAYCDPADGCTLKKTLIEPCGGDSECASDHCVDGYCCDTACTGQCEACDVAGRLGLCSGVSGAPHGARTPCATDGSLCGGACNGIVQTACTYPTGTQCRAASCASGVETLAASCDGAGACPLQTEDCSPGICEGAACDADCTTDAECDVSAYCAVGTCTTKLDDGSACSGNNACASGFCVDGVCCDVACGEQCEACDIAGYEGVCLPTPNNDQPHGTRPLCTTDGSSCGGECDGIQTTVCAYAGSGTECSAGSCTSDYATLPSQCNGTGVCPEAVVQPCTPYECSGTACGGCTDDTQCDSGFYCSGGLCKEEQANGTACVDAVQCTSGLCVDGICCNAACDGQCEACDVAGNLGTCSPVPNGEAPHGGLRPQCGGDTICGGTCTGVSRTACGFAPTTVSCRAPSCSTGTAIVQARCDGVGSCPAEQTVTCGSGNCLGTQCDGCALDTDCPTDNHCLAGTCVAFRQQGEGCSQSSDCVSGLSCVDGVCCDSACTGQCEACDVAGSAGTCTLIPDGQQPHGRSPCQGTGTCRATCDGSSATACAYPGGTRICALGSCNDGVETTAAYCDGAGACPVQTTAECGEYACGATGCETTCDAASDCAIGYWCLGNQCLPIGSGADSGAGGALGTDSGAGGSPGGDGGAGGEGAAGASGDAAVATGGASGSSGADSGTDAAGFDEPIANDSGCGCRTPAAPAQNSGAAVVSLMALFALSRRRPRRAA